MRSRISLARLSKPNLWLYCFTALVLLGQIYAITSGHHFLILIAFLPLVFVLLFHVEKIFLFFLILSARIFLDSIPNITYPKLSFGLSFMEYFTLGLMTFMVTYLLLHRGIEFDSISKSMLAVLVAMAFTTVYHRNLTDLIDLSSLWLYFALAYLFFKHISRDVSIDYIVNLIVITSFYPFLNQLYSIITGAGRVHLGLARYAGTFHHPHNVADYLFFAIPAALYLFRTETRIKAKAIYIFAMVFFHIGILTAGYVTNWIAVFIFWCCYTMFGSRRKEVSILLLCLITILSWNFFGGILFSRLTPLKTLLENPAPLLSLENYEYNSFLTGRIGIWKTSYHEYKNSGFIEKLIGIGINKSYEISERFLGVRTDMHNEYLAFLVETGILGLSLLLLSILLVVRALFRSLYTGNPYFPIVLSAFIACLVIGLAGMPFRDVRVFNYLSIYLGIMSHQHLSSQRHIMREG